MPRKNKHYRDVHFWILSVIKSCNNLQQLNAVENLIDNFQIFCKNYISEDSINTMTAQLRMAIQLHPLNKCLNLI